MLLAQFNIAKIKYELSDPRMKTFVDNIDIVHKIAAKIGGLVVRLSDMSGTALNMRVYNDPTIIPNLTVWKDFASLEKFVYKTIHKRFYDNRDEWFEKDLPGGLPKNVMWWVDEMYSPKMSDGETRLNHLKEHGATEYAFDWTYIRDINNSKMQTYDIMSVSNILIYLQDIMEVEERHKDWRNHIINTNQYFVLRDVSVALLKSGIGELDRGRVEQYKQMNSLLPIVVGSDGHIIDGYHRVNAAKALSIPFIKGYVGIKQGQDFERRIVEEQVSTN